MRNCLNRIILLCCFLISATCCAAQQTGHQEREVLLYNVSFGAVTAGVGSVINKPKGMNWRKAFVRGAWQGSIGGFTNYASKKTLYLINKKQSNFYALPAKLLYSAGSSVIENAALHQPFLENWTLDYGPIRFDFSLHKKIFRARFLPEVIPAAIFSGHYAKFNLGESLITGVLIFKTNKYYPRQGISFGRALAYSVHPWFPDNPYQVLVHELVHSYQYRDYQVLNTWIKPLSKNIHMKAGKRRLSGYIYFDFPYVLPFYLAEGYHDYYHYFKNFYEFEAQRFAANKYVPYRH